MNESDFEAGHEARALVSLKGQFLRVNQRFCELLGYSPKDFEQLSVRDITHPQDRAQSVNIVDQSLLYERGPITVIKRYLHGEGRTIWARLRTTLLRNEQGEVLHFFSVIEDITDRVFGDEMLRTFAYRFQEVVEFERQRIAREVHDQLGQMLTAIKLEVHRLEEALPEPKEAKSLNGLVDETMVYLRNITSSLRPPILDDLGLEPAIAWMLEESCERAGLEFAFKRPERPLTLDWEVRIALFRVFQEALNNVLRHAQAGRVRVELATVGGMVKLTVEDDGIGLNGGPGFGMAGMRERAHLLGGVCRFSAVEPAGTRVTIEVPVPPEMAASRIPREYWE